MSKVPVVVTCEHGGNRVPPRYADLFAGRPARAALQSHRGSDIGALKVARAIARRLGVTVIASTTTRLLVELNRSVGHRHLFSEFMQRLSPTERASVLDRYYSPYRARVESTLRQYLDRGGPVLHISVHSFTPQLRGETRTADVGLLYDPGRRSERRFCADWKEAFKALYPDIRVRRNYPYLGKNDGLTTSLRRLFGPREYIGIELEVSQGLLAGEPADGRRVTAAVVESLVAVLG